MNIVIEYLLLTVAFTVLAQPSLARTKLNCDVLEVIIASSQAGGTSAQSRRRLVFWLDDVSKTLTFSDGSPMRVIRFDDTSIRAASDDMLYNYSRSDNTLTYAGSATEGAITRTTVGSGHCAETP